MHNPCNQVHPYHTPLLLWIMVLGCIYRIGILELDFPLTTQTYESRLESVVGQVHVHVSKGL